MFTVHSTDPAYTAPLIGNGEVVTTLGPTGYHKGLCPAEEAANRTLFWAGRRWSFRIPQCLAATTQFAADVTPSRPNALGLVPMTCTLKVGTTRLV